MSFTTFGCRLYRLRPPTIVYKRLPRDWSTSLCTLLRVGFPKSKKSSSLTSNPISAAADHDVVIVNVPMIFPQGMKSGDSLRQHVQHVKRFERR